MGAGVGTGVGAGVGADVGASVGVVTGDEMLESVYRDFPLITTGYRPRKRRVISLCASW